MKYRLIIILFLNSLQFVGQESIVKDEYGETPFGVISKSNIHYVAKNQYLNIKDKSIVITEFKSNSVINEVEYGKGSEINYHTNGWSTYAYGQIYETRPSEPTYFEVTFVVPPAPKDNHQLIYIFNGLGTIDSGIAYIVQPVLQWGLSPAGGGPYWGICNWYVNSNQFFHDSLIRVEPGDTLRGLIELTSTSDGKFNYNSSFIGYQSGLQVLNLPELVEFYVVLETYRADCDDLPNDEKIKFRNIRVKSKIDNPTLSWHKLDLNSCGQYTTIVNQNSSGGEIHINFHSPLSIDDFDEIHIYPNPVKDFLHISPNGIKSVIGYRREIKECTIQIFNSGGSLVFSDFYPNFDNEFNLDLRHIKPGIYLMRFIYESKFHTFKLIKI